MLYWSYIVQFVPICRTQLHQSFYISLDVCKETPTSPSNSMLKQLVNVIPTFTLTSGATNCAAQLVCPFPFSTEKQD